MQKKFTTKTLVISALLAALSVILRLLGFPQDGTFRIELGFIPIAVSGYLYGGIISGITYVIADIIGTLFTGMSPFFPITVCKFLMGVIYGLFFYKGNKSLKNIIFCTLVIAVLIDLVFMPFALLPISGSKTFWGILMTRIIATGFNVPLRIVSLYVTFKYLSFDGIKEKRG